MQIIRVRGCNSNMHASMRGVERACDRERCTQQEEILLTRRELK